MFSCKSILHVCDVIIIICELCYIASICNHDSSACLGLCNAVVNMFV